MEETELEPIYDADAVLPYRVTLKIEDDFTKWGQGMNSAKMASAETWCQSTFGEKWSTYNEEGNWYLDYVPRFALDVWFRNESDALMFTLWAR